MVAYFKDEGIVSPRREKVLPGVSLAVLRELAEARGISCLERDLTVEAFRRADEVWLTSTSVCLLPVTQLDDQPIGGGSPGPVFKQMLAAWSGAVGLDIAAQAVTQWKNRARSSE